MDHRFELKLKSAVETCRHWEADKELLKRVRDSIPFEKLRDPNGVFSRPEDAQLGTSSSNLVFLQRLCRYFKDTMTWINQPACKNCGKEKPEFVQTRGPLTAEEREGRAQRVEVYKCQACPATETAFPRYNSVRKLFETKQGRCGEYANLFGLYCRAVGFETRFLNCSTDHVWVEVFLEDRWVMADGCEGVIDEPSMYEHGWGKQGICYCIATSIDQIMDVTPRYTRKYLSDQTQSLRRAHTSSELVSKRIIDQMNALLKTQNKLPESRVLELNRRRAIEQHQLDGYMQQSEWSQQERYQRGRSSGSLEWTKARGEAGREGTNCDQGEDSVLVAGFQIESFFPPTSSTVSISVKPNPSTSRHGIIVSGAACAVGEPNSVSVVVIDDKALGCILQSRCFKTVTAFRDFIDSLPAGRLVAVNGSFEKDSTDSTFALSPRLENLKAPPIESKGLLFIGQVDASPDWTFYSTYEACEKGHQVDIECDTFKCDLKLRTERNVRPSSVAGRIPESHMPLATQVQASEEQKRKAFTSFALDNQRYSGYTTKPGLPIYLLDSSAYPFVSSNRVPEFEVWNTFHYLPSPLVSPIDNGIQESMDDEIPRFEVPLDENFFETSLGSDLLVDTNNVLPTSEALRNARLVGLYFSAHWCGPCKKFSPMLVEMYLHLKEKYPCHGLEIVFVSSDRDQQAFDSYYSSMPWRAIPFGQLARVKQILGATYGVRGIPSLVILDALTGNVVVPGDQCRGEVAVACRGGDIQVEMLLESWLDRVPSESKQIFDMLKLSCMGDDDDIQTYYEDEAKLYLCRKKTENGDTNDLGARVKEIFSKLVAGGEEPNAAAAEAIKLASENPICDGSLTRKSISSGEPTEESIDLALSRTVELTSSEDAREMLSTAAKYVTNVKREPWTAKFRTFKLSNKVADRFCRNEGSIRLLRALGFQVFGTSQEFVGTIPSATDLESLEKKIIELIESLDEK